jgi:hypothetical protein
MGRLPFEQVVEPVPEKMEPQYDEQDRHRRDGQKFPWRR